MNRVDVDIYDGDVQVYSEEDKVTKALTFYLRMKGVSAVLEGIGWIFLMSGLGLSLYTAMKFIQTVIEKR